MFFIVSVMAGHSINKWCRYSTLNNYPITVDTIISVFKSGDKSLPSNYRPISLTYVLSRVIERKKS